MMMNYLRSKSCTFSGFTLIELMFVIAIVGILASLAIPTYRDYILRARVGATISYMDGLKTDISNEMATTETITNRDPISTPMEYVQCITYSIYDEGSGSCSHVYIESWPNNAFDASISPGNTRMVVMEGIVDDLGNIVWKCGPSPKQKDAIAASLFPAACRDTLTTTSGKDCLVGTERAMNVKCRNEDTSGSKAKETKKEPPKTKPKETKEEPPTTRQEVRHREREVRQKEKAENWARERERAKKERDDAWAPEAERAKKEREDVWTGEGSFDEKKQQSEEINRKYAKLREEVHGEINRRMMERARKRSEEINQESQERLNEALAEFDRQSK